jgi:cytochrome c
MKIDDLYKFHILQCLALLLAIHSNIACAQDRNIASEEAIFTQCSACHSLKDGDNKIGPSLYHLIDRKAGTSTGFRYSSAVKNSQIIWTKDTLDQFLENPQKILPGNRMPYSGLENKKDRETLIDYLTSK